MSIRIRRARSSDLEEIVAIEERCFTSEWPRDALAAELVPHPRRWPLVAIDAESDQLIGYSMVWVIADELHLVNLAVHPERRREGIAERLVQEILDSVPGRKASVMTLEVRAGNEAAIALYRRFGFYEVAMRPRYYPDNQEDALIMLKPLRPRGEPPAGSGPDPITD